MEINNRFKHRNNVVLSGVLAFAILTSGCAKSGDEVTVKMREAKEVEDVKPTVEVEEDVSWAEFDESVLMYKIDFDKFIKDKLKLSKKTLENSDVINLLEMVQDELGEDIYTKEKNSNFFCNLEGKFVTVSASDGRWLFVKFYDGEDILSEGSLEYEVHVEKNGKTGNMSRSREEGLHKFLKYYVIYGDNKEFTRSICIRESATEYLSVGLHEGDFFDSHSNSFSTELGDASIKLSKEDYNELYEIMLSYSDSDNLYSFFSNNLDLLNKYVDLIGTKNVEYSEYLSNLINGYIEKAKVLRYN